MTQQKRATNKLMHVWMVEESPSSSSDATKSFWTKIGVAVENPDGSLSLTLAAIPVTGKMILREPAPPIAAPVSTRGAA